MSRWLIRSADAPRNLDVVFAFGVAAVLGNRYFLVLTGYPQVGGGALHISHAIWGGLMMVVAITAAVSVIHPGVRLFVAVLGGAGFGWFVDELGKFITKDVNYFYRPTLAIIYVLFVAMYLGFRVVDRRNYRPDEALLNALEATKHAVLGDLDVARQQEALRLLDELCTDEPLLGPIRSLLVEASTHPAHRPNWWVRQGRRLRAIVEDAAESPRFPYVFAAILLLLSASDVGQLVYLVGWGRGLHTFSDYAITVSVTASALFVVAGAFELRRSRSRGYHLFEASVLVSIFVTQVFLFHAAQLGGMLDLTVSLLIWAFLRTAIVVERTRAAVLEQAEHAPVPAPAG